MASTRPVPTSLAPVDGASPAPGAPTGAQLTLSVIRATLVSYFSQPAFSIPVLGGLLLAYAGELGSPTFNTDRFFEIWFRNYMLDYWTGYGRYLSKLLFLAMDRVYAPTFLLLVGLALLCCVGVLLCELWGVTGNARPILVLILCTFPFFYETFCYIPTRYAVPLAVACAVIGVMRGGVIGLLLAFCAMLLYQASASLAAVVVLVWAALEALRGKPWLACVRTILVPKILLLLVAIAVDTLMLRLVNAYLRPDFVTGQRRHWLTGPVSLQLCDAAAGHGVLLLRARSVSVSAVDQAYRRGWNPDHCGKPEP